MSIFLQFSAHHSTCTRNNLPHPLHCRMQKKKTGESSMGKKTKRVLQSELRHRKEKKGRGRNIWATILWDLQQLRLLIYINTPNVLLKIILIKMYFVKMNLIIDPRCKAGKLRNKKSMLWTNYVSQSLKHTHTVCFVGSHKKRIN